MMALVPARNGAGGDHRVGQRCARGAVGTEEHLLPGVVVHGGDPGAGLDPERRRAARTAPLIVASVQRADERPQGGVLAPAVRQPAAGGNPRGHPVRPEQARASQRYRADPQVRQRRQRPVQCGERGGFAQDSGGLPALPGHHLLEPGMAAQGCGQHAARACPDDDVNVAGGARQLVLQAGQRAGHPGRAEHAARPEHQAGPARRPVPHGPIRTENDSSHFSSPSPLQTIRATATYPGRSAVLLAASEFYPW